MNLESDKESTNCKSPGPDAKTAEFYKLLTVA